MLRFGGSSKRARDSELTKADFYRLSPNAAITWVPDPRAEVMDLALVSECCFQQTKATRDPSSIVLDDFIAQGRADPESTEPEAGTLAWELRALEQAAPSKKAEHLQRVLTQSSHLGPTAQRLVETILSNPNNAEHKAQFCELRSRSPAQAVSKICR